MHLDISTRVFEFHLKGCEIGIRWEIEAGYVQNFECFAGILVKDAISKREKENQYCRYYSESVYQLEKQGQHVKRVFKH